MSDQIVNPTKLVAVYGRVSTSNQENEGTIQTQLLAVKEFCTKQSFLIVENYTDEGWSGDTLIRPALDRLRMDAKKKKWDGVVIYDPDRLARRYSYQELVTDELKEAGIDVIFVTRPAPKNSEDKILFGVRGLFAEYERTKIAERFRLGKVRKAREGHVITTEGPYGYTFIVRTKDKEGYYEINEREAQIVKNIFSWVANEGLTLRKVVRRLQDLKIAPRKSKRGVWNTSTLSTLLRNKTYIGEAHYGASYATIPINPFKKEIYRKNKKTSRRDKPEDEWIKIAVPRLIEDDLFNRAQQRLKENFYMCSRNTKNQYLLAQRIWCPCGQRRAGEGPMKGKHLYYRCNDRVLSFPLPHKCKERGLKARIVDDLVWNKVSQLMSSPELMQKQAERWLKNKNQGKTSTINVEETTKEISKLKEQEERHAKAYGAGVFTIDQLKEYTLPIKEKVFMLSEQLLKAQSENSNLDQLTLPKVSEIKSFAQQATEYLQKLSFDQKRVIIRNTVEKVVGTRSELKVYGCIPVTENINVITIHRNRRPTKCR